MFDSWGWPYNPVDAFFDIDRLEPDQDEAGGASAPIVASSSQLKHVGIADSSEDTRRASSKQIVCQHCDKTFIRASAYREHMNMHSREKRKCKEPSEIYQKLTQLLLAHRCPSCNKPFSVRSNMLRHHRKKHPGDDNLHQAPHPSEETSNIAGSSTIPAQERSYKDPGYCVYRLEGYERSNSRTNNVTGPTRRVRGYTTAKLHGV